MTNVLQKGAQWLSDQLKQCAGRMVTISDGINTVFNVTATMALADYETLDDEGFPLTVRSFDWVIAAADIGDVAIRAGTRISESIIGGSNTYEITPLSNRPAAEDNDTSGIMLLVHSKRVASTQINPVEMENQCPSPVP